MFQAWFNTNFFDQNGMIVVDKFMLDKACKVREFFNKLILCVFFFKDKTHKRFSKDFCMELHARYKDEKHEQLKNGAKRISNNAEIPSKFHF